MDSIKSRIRERPGERINRKQKVVFHFEGRRVQAFDGDTIASALYAAGRRIFTRSFKYHRPRGLLCVSGKCPNCLMNVDGIPSVRTCIEPVRDGMQVKHQNAFPSLEIDFFSIIEKFQYFLPAGFYYKTLYRPKWLWRLAEPWLRRTAGLGVVDTTRKAPHAFSHRNRHAHIVIVGGGPAGLAAALEAGSSGADVLLVDDQPQLGGHLNWDNRLYDEVGVYSGLRGFEIARRMTESLQSLQNVEILCGAKVFGGYEGGLLGIEHGKQLVHVRTKRLIVATGGHEYPLLFGNNDLPGVFLSTGLQRLVNLYGIDPGERVLVVANNQRGLAAACDLLEAGVPLCGVVVPKKAIQQTGHESVTTLMRAKVPLFDSHVIKEAIGRKHVSGAVLLRCEPDGTAIAGSEQQIACDLICISTGFCTANELLYHRGGKLSYDALTGEFIPQQPPEGVYVAGDVTGLHFLPITLLQGKLAGFQAVSELRHGRGEAIIAEYRRELAALEQVYQQSGSCSLAAPELSTKKNTVCFCEDVTDQDLEDSIAEGFDEIQTLKRYSTVSMGPCQGKMCLMSSISACATMTGKSIPATGTTTARPPIHPVSLGALAGSHHQVTKLTPMQYKHLSLGARITDMGPWKRPHTYTSTEQEYRAVRQRVGVIDVSTLGKLDVQGPDAAALLDKVYTQTFSDLKVGRARYGVMCDDSGIILDDGTVSRLAEDRFFVTTTTGNIEFVEQWLKWWSAGPTMQVYITNITAGFGAVNIAGPDARTLLGKLTKGGLSSAQFPYMSCAQWEVAGVPAMLLRVGFVGEMGWEIHFPAEYGEYMWDTILDAGKELSVEPFGVEAQRILRLEKKHIIVGHDTDALSNPLEADMPWVVKFEKQDFIGKRSLLALRESGLRNVLVGLELHDAQGAEDGSPVVWKGRSVGRVTSLRRSSTLDRFVALAWVPVEQSHEGAEVAIRGVSGEARAKVTRQPFYDPKGTKLRG